MFDLAVVQPHTALMPCSPVEVVPSPQPVPTLEARWGPPSLQLPQVKGSGCEMGVPTWPPVRDAGEYGVELLMHMMNR